jgi:TPP-dependent indolepyruvate ferredoxin oxidoreductase alpha subunit
MKDRMVLPRRRHQPSTTRLPEAAVAPWAESAPRRAPLAVAEARCNRCGACLALGCPAIEDAGGEGLSIDPARCTGCGLCGPLCRARAIGPALHLLEASTAGDWSP